MKHFTLFKTWLLAVVMLLVGGGVWAAENDVVYTLTGSTGQPFGSSNTYELKSGTYNSVAWTATLGSCQNASAFWLGSNSKQKAKMVLGSTYAKVGAPMSFTASTTYVTALIAGSDFSNVGKVTIANSATGGTVESAISVYLVYSTDGGTTYSLVTSTPTSPQTATNGGTLTYSFTTIPSARYAVVMKGTNDFTFRVPVVTFYEGASESSCTPPDFMFNEDTVEKLVTDAPFINDFISDNVSDMVWTSSNTAVATVDEDTGEVTIVGAGSTTISVTQDADGTYCAVDASYELTVNPLPAPTATAATAVGETGFTANWNAVTGASDYKLSVYSGSVLIDEDFSDITNGNSDSSTGSNTAWTGNDNFSVLTVYQAGGAVRLGSSSAVGSITSKAINLTQGATLTFDVKGWINVEGDILVTVEDGTAQTVTYTAKMADAFETKTVTLAPATATSKVKIATSAKRAFITNVKIANTIDAAGSPLSVTGTSKALTGLASGTKYFYTVKAVAGAFESDASNEIEVTTLGSAQPVPTISVSEATVSITAEAYESDGDMIEVTASNLTEKINVALSGTDAAMFSFELDENFEDLEGGYVYIYYNPTVVGSHSATLTISSDGATSKQVALSGTATVPTVTAPIALGIVGNLFKKVTAVWGEVAGAHKYELNVYQKVSGGTATETESFDNVTPDKDGKIIESASYLPGWSVLSQDSKRQVYTSTGNYGLASPSFALTTTGDYIQTAVYPSYIKAISFWTRDQKGSDPSTSSTLIEGKNSSDQWVAIASFNNADVTTAITKSYDLEVLNLIDIKQIRLVYTKALGNLAIDDITVTTTGVVNNHVAGSPFTVTETEEDPATPGVIQYTADGLERVTEYWFSVVAFKGEYASLPSEEINFTTGPLTDVEQTLSSKAIYAHNEQVFVHTTAGTSIEIFNVAGQKVSTTIAHDGLNIIPVTQKGVLVVKVGGMDVVKVVN